MPINLSLYQETAWYKFLGIWLSPLHWLALLYAFYPDAIVAEIILIKTQIYDFSYDQISNVKLSLARRWDDVMYRTAFSHDPFRTFHLFPGLPAEIRIRIWQHALPGPRVIEIRTDHLPTCVRNSYRWLRPRSICRIPTPLHVCRESRAEALKQYELSFGLETTRNLGTLRTCPAIYIDFAKDIVFFGEKGSFSAMQRGTEEGEFKGLEKVRHLALRDGRTRRTRRSTIHGIDFRVLQGVKKLIFVAQSHGERIFELGKEPNLVLFDDADWNRKLEEIGALRELASMRKLLEGAGRRSSSEVPGIWNEDEEEWEYDVERDYQGLPHVEVSIGTFIKGVGDSWYHAGADWPF